MNEPTFDKLVRTVREATMLEGYRDASPEDIDKAAVELREAFTEFVNLPAVRSLFGEARCADAARVLDEDTRKCGNCGEIDCESPDCEDD